jgi:hypothetical protein
MQERCRVLCRVYEFQDGFGLCHHFHHPEFPHPLGWKQDFGPFSPLSEIIFPIVLESFYPFSCVC